MKRKLYNSNLEDLLQFIADMQTRIAINIKTDKTILRTSDFYKTKYDSTLISVNSDYITPTFNVVHDELKKESTIAAYIPAMNIALSLKYVDSSTTCGFKFNFPSTRILRIMQDDDLNKYLSDFYSCEKYIESIVEEYLKEKVDALFYGEIGDCNSNTPWFLHCSSYKIEMLKKHI